MRHSENGSSFSWKKILHKFCYWTNPFYMISTDLKNNPKAQKFIAEYFGHILKPIVIFLDKILNGFKMCLPAFAVLLTGQGVARILGVQSMVGIIICTLLGSIVIVAVNKGDADIG